MTFDLFIVKVKLIWPLDKKEMACVNETLVNYSNGVKLCNSTNIVPAWL